MSRCIYVYFLTWLLLIHTISLSAKGHTQQSTIEQATIKADEIIYQNGISNVQGNVQFKGYGYNIKANRVIYQHATKQLEFFGKIQIEQEATKENNYLFTDYLKANIADDHLIIKPFFLRNEVQKQGKSNHRLKNSIDKIWIQAQCADKKGYEYNLTKGSFSSCEDNTDPFWHIGFSQATYNANIESLYLKDATFFIQDVPIVYLPFFSLYTGSDQKSGLLTPNISFSSSQISLAQPIFFVPKPHIDIQITPQFRNKEGFGLYSTTRFIDSNRSQGNLTIGYFNQQTNKSTAYGMEFNYYRKFINDIDEQSLFLSQIQYFNTIAYFNYKKLDTSDLAIDSISQSALSYIHSYQDWFVSVNIKEFEQTKNGNKIQLLPLLKLHKSNTHLLEDMVDEQYIDNNLILGWLNRFIYTIDYSIQYLNRHKKGSIDSLTQRLALPITYNISLFDDYINLFIQEEFKVTSNNYYIANKEVDSISFQQHLNTIGISSNLVKSYDDVLHNISFSANINQLISGKSPSSTYRYSINIAMEQYFLKEQEYTLTHNLQQNIYKTKDGGFSDFDDITNYIKWKSDVLNIYNKSIFSLKDKELSYLSTLLEYEQDDSKWYLSQLIDNKIQDDDQGSNYIGVGLTQFVFDVKLDFDIQIDYRQQDVTKWMGAIEYIQDCWGYTVKIGRNTIPLLDASKWQRSDHNYMIYLQMKFNPIGGFSQSYYF